MPKMHHIGWIQVDLVTAIAWVWLALEIENIPIQPHSTIGHTLYIVLCYR